MNVKRENLKPRARTIRCISVYGFLPLFLKCLLRVLLEQNAINANAINANA